MEWWVAFIPGRGVARIYCERECWICQTLNGDGDFTASGQPPDWMDLTTWFRPTDEHRDPGLADRFETAEAKVEASNSPPGC